MSNQIIEFSAYCFLQNKLDPKHNKQFDLITCLKIKSHSLTVFDLIESLNNQLIQNNPKFAKSWKAFEIRLFNLESRRKLRKPLTNNTRIVQNEKYAIIFYDINKNNSKFLFIHPLSFNILFNVRDHKGKLIKDFAKSIKSLLPPKSNLINFYKIVDDGFECLYDQDKFEMVKPNDRILPSLIMKINNKEIVGPFYGTLEQYLATDEMECILDMGSMRYLDNGNTIDKIPQSNDEMTQIFNYSIKV